MGNDIQFLEFNGTVKNIIFRNEKNGYTVLEIINQIEEIVAVGIIPFVNVGEGIKIFGNFKTHPTFGRQFSVEKYERYMPKTEDAILRYLIFGAVKGIGKLTAQRLVDKFGKESLNIIENNPEKIAELPGFSLSRAQKISSEFKKMSSIKKLIEYLEKFTVTIEECVKIWQVLGSSALDKIKEDPYVITYEPMFITFEKADAIAQSMEISRDDVRRIRSGILYVLTHNMRNGHTCLPKDKLCEASADFLEVDIDFVKNCLSFLERTEKIVLDEFMEREFVFLSSMHNSEIYSAARILMMMNSVIEPIKNIDEEINLIERRNNISYAPLQKEAIRLALSKAILILTGGPGTGKTTTLKAILKIFSKNGQKIMVAAPTGRAAQRISQVTGFHARTIHRLLGVGWGEDESTVFRKNEKNLLRCNVLVIDEFSMVDSILFENVIRALPLGCRLILVGDSDQLPSIRAGNVLGDLIKSKVVPVIELKEIFRQSLESLIVTNAHKIVNGDMPELDCKTGDFFFIEKLSAQDTLETIVDLYTRRLPNAYRFSIISDMQVICPSRKGVLGTVNINTFLQKKINPPSKNKTEITVYSSVLREGDKVMQSKNNYDVPFIKNDGTSGEGVFNGDIGILSKINRSEGYVKVEFDDRVATYEIDDVSNLELAYAITVHKSQGNEFEAVLMPMICNIPQLSYRNLLYTAVTRAKSLIILVGEKKSLKSMVENDKKTRRYSGLYHFLVRGMF